MITIKEIVSYLEEIGFRCQTLGREDVAINVYSSFSELKDNSITWVKKPESCDISAFDNASNVLVVTSSAIPNLKDSVGQLVTTNPKGAFFSVVKKFFVHDNPTFISTTAIIETKRVGTGVSVGHFSYVCAEAEIADDVVIGNNVSIECPCRIGAHSRIGSGTIIGNDGYGYYKNAQGLYCRVPHTGGVVIGKYVEVDANVCIDRGTIGDTVIEDYVKIDNFSHIAHNVHIGKNTLIIAHAMLAGSCYVGENGYVAPGALIMNQKKVGKGSLIGMGAVVVRNVPSGKVVSGNPAVVLWDNQ